MQFSSFFGRLDSAAKLSPGIDMDVSTGDFVGGRDIIDQLGNRDSPPSLQTVAYDLCLQSISLTNLAVW